MFEISKGQIKKLKVKSIIERSFNIKDGQVNDTVNEETIYNYDREGNNIYQQSDLNESIFEYNTFGDVIKHIYICNASIYTNRYDRSYTQKGLMIEERIKNMDTD